jgi:hypothetical protein
MAALLALETEVPVTRVVVAVPFSPLLPFSPVWSSTGDVYADWDIDALTSTMAEVFEKDASRIIPTVVPCKPHGRAKYGDGGFNRPEGTRLTPSRHRRSSAYAAVLLRTLGVRDACEWAIFSLSRIASSPGWPYSVITSRPPSWWPS